MHSYSVSYSFRGPNHHDGTSLVTARDSYEAEMIVRNKYRDREIWISLFDSVISGVPDLLPGHR